jgi:hypothetical protein
MCFVQHFSFQQGGSAAESCAFRSRACPCTGRQRYRMSLRAPECVTFLDVLFRSRSRNSLRERC